MTDPKHFLRTPVLVRSVSARVVAILGTLISVICASADGGRLFIHVILMRELLKYLNVQSSKLVKSKPLTTSPGDCETRLNST